MQRLRSKRHYCVEDLRIIQCSRRVGPWGLEEGRREIWRGKASELNQGGQTLSCECGEPPKTDIIKFMFDNDFAAIWWIGGEAVRVRHPVSTSCGRGDNN